MPAQRQRKGLRRRTTKPVKSQSTGLNPVEKKQVKRIIDSKMETHLVEVQDTLDASVEITNGTPFVWADVMPLGIAEGTGEEQRVGDEITLQSYHLNYFINDDAVQQACYRLIAVYFPDSNGTGFEALYTNDMLAFHPRKEQTDLRYKILYDKIFIEKYLNTSDGLFRSSYKTLTLPVKGLKVQFDSSATTVNRGNIKMIILTQLGNDTPLNHSADFSANAVLRWKD
uniref:hypothetical protein n=1 Tax=Aliarcobacter sp. TaxID=2321116 RepID=UPI00404826AA